MREVEETLAHNLREVREKKGYTLKDVVKGTGYTEVSISRWEKWICSDNDKDDLFIEWGKEAMIKGLSHILVYQDEESHTKMMRVSPEDLIVVYKNSSTKEPAYKIRLYDIDTEDTKRTTHYAEVYSPKDNKDKLPSKMFSQ